MHSFAFYCRKIEPALRLFYYARPALVNMDVPRECLSFMFAVGNFEKRARCTQEYFKLHFVAFSQLRQKISTCAKPLDFQKYGRYN